MRRLLFCLALLTAAGCRENMSPSGLRAFVSLSANEISRGETVDVIVTVINTSDSPRLARLDACGGAFVVEGMAGNRIGPASRACLAVLLPPVQIEPGDSYAVTFRWDGRMSTETLDEGPLAPKGAYVIRAVVSTSESIDRSDGALLEIL